MSTLRLGSPDHRDLFGEPFVASHRIYEPEGLPWPALPPPLGARARADDLTGAPTRAVTSGALRRRSAVIAEAVRFAGRFSRPAGAALLAGAVALAGAACRPATDGPSARDLRQLRGEIREVPNPVPDFTLVDTAGHPFRFQKEANRFVTLLYFGYTHCPDICPVHLANLSAVLNELPWDLRQRIKVVFVTTDPDRDTRVVLRQWLDAVDPTFVGLSGSLAQVNAAQALLGIPPVIREERASGNYVVGHAAQVIAFTPDGRTRVDYAFGTRQADWAHDLPLLAGPVRTGP